jgi:hypothetical protein
MKNLAQARANATGHAYMAWLDALSEGRTLQDEARLGERSFRQLAEACESPRQFAIVIEALDEYAKENPDEPNGFARLAEQVNDSPYDLGEWVEALEYFYDWLEQNQRTGAFKTILGFLGCSVESLPSLADKPPLRDLAADMLDEYGFQG